MFLVNAARAGHLVVLPDSARSLWVAICGGHNPSPETEAKKILLAFYARRDLQNDFMERASVLNWTSEHSAKSKTRKSAERTALPRYLTRTVQQRSRRGASVRMTVKTLAAALGVASHNFKRLQPPRPAVAAAAGADSRGGELGYPGPITLAEPSEEVRRMRPRPSFGWRRRPRSLIRSLSSS